MFLCVSFGSGGTIPWCFLPKQAPSYYFVVITIVYNNNNGFRISNSNPTTKKHHHQNHQHRAPPQKHYSVSCSTVQTGRVTGQKMPTCWSPRHRADRAGGLLMYGIPSMKLDKIEKVMRRIKLLQQDAWTLADACGRWRTLAYAGVRCVGSK